jgi:hypothetical protein
MADSQFKPMGIWKVALISKGGMALAVAAALFFSFDLDPFVSTFARWPRTGSPTLWSRFATWDGAHYLLLSTEGYERGSPSCAFYPLWPALIRLASPLAFGNPLAAGLVLANGLSLVSIVLLYRLFEPYGARTARQAVILFLAFPGALFLSFPYTESLFLVLVLALFWGLETQRWLWPAIAGFLLPVARPVGVFVALPVAWRLYELGKSARAAPATARVARRRNWRWLLALCPLLGYAAYFGLMEAWTGNAFEGFEAQKRYPNSPSIMNMFDCAGFLGALANVHTLCGMRDSAMDRAFFLLALALLPLIYRLNKTWFFYTLSTGLVPALTSWFMSYRRYTVVLFPVFVVLAQLLAKGGRRWLFWYYVILLAALQAWAVWQFVNFRWAG